MKSTLASSRTLKTLLQNTSVLLLNEAPSEAPLNPTNYTGSQSVPVTWQFSEQRASNSEKISFAKNKGTTTATAHAVAIIDPDGKWMYAIALNPPIEIKANSEPYLDVGDLIIED